MPTRLIKEQKNFTKDSLRVLIALNERAHQVLMLLDGTVSAEDKGAQDAEQRGTLWRGHVPGVQRLHNVPSPLSPEERAQLEVLRSTQHTGFVYYRASGKTSFDFFVSSFA